MGGLLSRTSKGFGALLLAALAACGGRSSPIDPDAVTIAANQPSETTSGGGTGATSGNSATGSATASGGKSGVPAGGSATGAASGVGTAGSSSTPSGGSSSGGSSSGGAGAAGAATGGSTSTEPSFVRSCNSYCSVAAQGPCPSGISSTECLASCVNELSRQTLLCQTYGEGLLRCLTAVYTNSNSCGEVDQLSLAKCSSQFTTYQNCSGPGSTPVPPPTPTPMVTCSSSGSSSNGKCNLDVKCTSGAYYTVSCYQTGPEQSNCTCNASLPNGTGTGANFGLNENSTFACYDSLATCGFPDIGAK